MWHVELKELHHRDAYVWAMCAVLRGRHLDFRRWRFPQVTFLVWHKGININNYAPHQQLTPQSAYSPFHYVQKFHSDVKLWKPLCRWHIEPLWWQLPWHNQQYMDFVGQQLNVDNKTLFSHVSHSLALILRGLLIFNHMNEKNIVKVYIAITDNLETFHIPCLLHFIPLIHPSIHTCHRPRLDIIRMGSCRIDA